MAKAPAKHATEGDVSLSGFAAGGTNERYILDEQVGFLLRQVTQRHTSIFAAHVQNDLTPTQWAALAKLLEVGSLSQNLLGRQTAMDAATIKGVVDRLGKRGLVSTRSDTTDTRLVVVDLTDAGRALAIRVTGLAAAATEATLQPLGERERETLLRLLRKLR
jgi:DNA-binding MarR family transcriptional regulator